MAAYYSNWNATLGVALQLETKHRSQPLKISCVLALQLMMAQDVKVSLEKGKEAWLLKGKGWTGTGWITSLKPRTQRAHAGSHYSPRQTRGHDGGATLQRLQSKESLSEGLRNHFSASLARLIRGSWSQCLYSDGLCRSVCTQGLQTNTPPSWRY